MIRYVLPTFASRRFNQDVDRSCPGIQSVLTAKRESLQA